MIDKNKKKTWTERALIVLVRGKPEEAVLGVCKLWNVVGDPYSLGFQCESANHANCGSACSSTLGS